MVLTVSVSGVETDSWDIAGDMLAALFAEIRLVLFLAFCFFLKRFMYSCAFST
jgi:uncharacterized membrane protein YjdF